MTVKNTSAQDVLLISTLNVQLEITFPAVLMK